MEGGSREGSVAEVGTAAGDATDAVVAVFEPVAVAVAVAESSVAVAVDDDEASGAPVASGADEVADAVARLGQEVELSSVEVTPIGRGPNGGCVGKSSAGSTSSVGRVSNSGRLGG